MNTIGKPVPRFVPTLTEVVDKFGMNVVTVQAQTDIAALVQAVHQQIEPIIEQLLKKEVDRLIQVVLAEQWEEMVVQLKCEIDKYVHTAIMETGNIQDALITKK